MRKFLQISFLFSAFYFALGIARVIAQCPMCKAVAESASRENDLGIAAALNSGILYLFAMPYLTIMIIAIVWFRNSRKKAAEGN